jgi:hypothetical protein
MKTIRFFLALSPSLLVSASCHAQNCLNSFTRSSVAASSFCSAYNKSSAGIHRDFQAHAPAGLPPRRQPHRDLPPLRYPFQLQQYVAITLPASAVTIGPTSCNPLTITTTTTSTVSWTPSFACSGFYDLIPPCIQFGLIIEVGEANPNANCVGNGIDDSFFSQCV